MMKRNLAATLMLAAFMSQGALADQHEELLRSEQLLNAAVVHQSSSELRLRNRLLKLTPLGSSPQRVHHVITDALHKPAAKYAKNYYTAETSAVDPKHSDNEMYVAGSIGIRYDEKMYWWMTGTDTDVTWYFDDHDRLINIIGWEHNTGL
jgi:hypothetical protein